MVPGNFFAAGNGDDLMAIVDPLLLQVCAQVTRRNLLMPTSDYDPNDSRFYIYSAIGNYIDIYGYPPPWAAAVLETNK